jgi:hypothetical protein
MSSEIQKPNPVKNADLFQLLFTSGRLSSTMLGVVKAFREQWHLTQYEACVSSHVTEESQLAECLSKSLELKRIYDIPSTVVDSDAMTKLTYKMAKTWGAIPIRETSDAKSITVVMADPTQVEGISVLRDALKCDFELAVCERQVILATIAQVYPLIKFPK